MEPPFWPTRQEVERYRRLRSLAKDLNHKILKTIPRQAYEDVGDAIGIRHNGVLMLDSMDMASVVTDCCLYDWFENGRNVVQRYADAHPARPGTDDSYLLNAYLEARYRVLVVQSAVSDAGLHCHDVLNKERLFLMDLAFSRSLSGSNAALATRTIPLGEYWMTAGAALPIYSGKPLQQALSRIERGNHKLLEDPGGLALCIVRACLAAGAADYITYQATERKPRAPRHQSRWPRLKRRR